MDCVRATRLISSKCADAYCCRLALFVVIDGSRAHPVTVGLEAALRNSRKVLRAREAPAAEKLAQEAFRTARTKLAQERSELAKTLADASARPSQDP